MASERDQVIIRRARAADIPVDEGLRAYMLKIYNYMGLALGVTGAVALAVASSDTMIQLIYGTPLKWVVMLGPLAFVLVLNFGVHRFSTATTQALFWTFAVLMGMSISSIFLVYTGESIARTFFIAAAMFGAMSLYGYTTKRSLISWGSFLIMGMIGIIIAIVVNMFMASDAIAFAISIIGVFIFLGLTAYYTQGLKSEYVQSNGTLVSEKSAIMGALSLYLVFINLFLFMLHLFGSRE